MLTHYVVVRADLPIGFMAAQIVHATGESVTGRVHPNTNAVVLVARDEAALSLLERQVTDAQIAHVAVREPDAPWNGALTAIGFEPIADRKLLRPFLGKFPLLGCGQRMSDAA